MTDTPRETKNAVFAAQPSATQTTTQRDPLLDEPVDLAPLPSNGLLYPVEHPFHGVREIEIKGITAREENILMNKAYAKKGTTITELLKSCLVDKSVSPTSLLLADRQTLLFAVRAAGYGSIYEDEVTCSDEDCGKRTVRTFNLSTFPIKRLDPQAIVSPGTNLFQFKLPSSGKTVEFRLLTGLDEEEMHLTAERQRKLIGGDQENSVTAMLLRSVVSVEGVTDRAHIARFVENMRGIDSVALRARVNEVTPGVQASQKMSCPACGYEEEVSMPLGVTFLWPSAG